MHKKGLKGVNLVLKSYYINLFNIFRVFYFRYQKSTKLVKDIKCRLPNKSFQQPL